MKHKLTGWECCVSHFDFNTMKPVPQCKICSLCKKYVAYDEVDNDCPGPDSPEQIEANAKEYEEGLVNILTKYYERNKE
jgi:hypothetical protein